MIRRRSLQHALLGSTAMVLVALTQATPAAAADISFFTPGDLVISTVSSLNGGGLDTAAPIVLQQFQLGAGGTTATPNGTFTLPQVSNGANSAISGEYGSASEGILQLSTDGHYLTIDGLRRERRDVQQRAAGHLRHDRARPDHQPDRPKRHHGAPRRRADRRQYQTSTPPQP